MLTLTNDYTLTPLCRLDISKAVIISIKRQRERQNTNVYVLDKSDKDLIWPPLPS
jgi:hypothetical protein